MQATGKWSRFTRLRPNRNSRPGWRRSILGGGYGEARRSLERVATAFADTSFSYDAHYVSPDGMRFAVATQNNFLVVSEKNPARELFRVQFTRDGASVHSRIRRLLFSPDGSRLAVQIDENFLVLDARTGLTRIRLPGLERGTIQVVAFSPDGTRLVTGASDHTAHLGGE